jgi:hypothetical protein
MSRSPWNFAERSRCGGAGEDDSGSYRPLEVRGSSGRADGAVAIAGRVAIWWNRDKLTFV